ncbi:MAG: peptide chain release factor 3 [Candidatus Obscuribacterales bacterium]|nr:peptide chain release factor 3 [Candidatus Obscuribacterales bacterium]
MNTELNRPAQDTSLTEFQVEIDAEARRRRTFAIISHPDAGKTTLTEKLLLYGGAIEEAGAVKSKRAQRSATSDWMELEKQRGISITSTVLQFEYKNYCLNLLDTPGHQDFSEDTYRTLAAADNAVMLIDAAKGLEAQTRKLFEVCHLRNLPMFTFINKLDRPGKDPFELLDEIEKEFKLPTYAVNWPIGTGDKFQGIVDRQSQVVHLFQRTVGGRTRAGDLSVPLHDERLKSHLSSTEYEQLFEDLSLLDSAGGALDVAAIEAGELTPVYFGSAMNNFGLELFLESFVDLAVSPASFESETGTIDPVYPEFTGFVFKLQANMDPKHRDRIAFVRICSGIFVKDMAVKNSRTGRTVVLNQPKKLFASERGSIERAYPGDVIGLNNPGAFTIGDTISTGKGVKFPGIPSFAPELFAYLENKEPSKYKQFHQGVSALQEEGAIQILWQTEGDTRTPILAAVGALQFEVVQFRLQAEYKVATILRPFDVRQALWVSDGWGALNASNRERCNFTVTNDMNDDPVLLFKQNWDLNWFREKNPNLTLSPISPHARLAKKG